MTGKPKARIITVSTGLYLIVLVPPIRGFDDFIGVWAHTAEPRFIVDTGPSVTAKPLLRSLDAIGFGTPEHILLTHIHLDHAGAVGEIAAAFPETPVICHASARPHLIDPEKLQVGTIKTLGETGRAYGPISPVPPERLVDADQVSAEGLKAIPTPGHATHHVSFLTSDGILFAGEAGGVNIAFSENDIYMRPATPPQFKLETTVASIDRLIDTDPAAICYGHLGKRAHAGFLLRRQIDQLFFWKEVVADERNGQDDPALADRCANRLLKTDTLIAGLSRVHRDTYERERFFIKNSIQGIAGYLSQNDM